VLSTLEYRLTMPTHMTVVARIATIVSEGESDLVVPLAQFGAHLALLDYNLASKSTGLIAIACVLVGMWIEGISACRLSLGPKSVGEVCGPETVNVALQLVDVWRRVNMTHKGGNSRWMLMKWPAMSKMFGAVDRCAFEEWLVLNWGEATNEDP